MKQLHTPCHRRLIDALRKAREGAEISQRDLSLKLRRSHSFAYYVESGERSLSVCEFIEYVRAVGADPAEVFDRVLGN